MRKEDDHNKVYSSADILRYLRGTLSSSEMHRLEKAAMQDPFLADAITGMEKLLRAGGTPEVDLGELEKRLADSTRSKRATLYFSWRTAAACLLLAGAAALTYFFMSTPDREERALATVERTTSHHRGNAACLNRTTFPPQTQGELQQRLPVLRQRTPSLPPKHPIPDNRILR